MKMTNQVYLVFEIWGMTRFRKEVSWRLSCFVAWSSLPRWDNPLDMPSSRWKHTHTLNASLFSPHSLDFWNCRISLFLVLSDEVQKPMLFSNLHFSFSQPRTTRLLSFPSNELQDSELWIQRNHLKSIQTQLPGFSGRERFLELWLRELLLSPLILPHFAQLVQFWISAFRVVEEVMCLSALNRPLLFWFGPPPSQRWA